MRFTDPAIQGTPPVRRILRQRRCSGRRCLFGVDTTPARHSRGYAPVPAVRDLSQAPMVSRQDAKAAKNTMKNWRAPHPCVKESRARGSPHNAVIAIEFRHPNRRIKLSHYRTPGSAFAEVHQIALLAELPQYPAGGGSGQRRPDVKYPNAVFFGERTGPAHRAQGNLLARGLHFQGVARRQMRARCAAA